MINKIRILILFMMLGICAVPSVTYAAECSEDAKKAARQAAQEQAKESFKTVQTDAETYNALAQDYLSKCNADIPANSPAGSSKEAVSAASQLGLKLDDPKIHQYRNISWLSPSTASCLGTDCTSPKVAECKQTALNASNALVKLNNSLNAVEQQLYATTDDAMTNCKCDENGVADCAVVKPSDEIEAEGSECQITGILNSLTACPLCPIFETIMKTNSDIAHLSWEATAEPLSKVVGIFFLVLLALEVLKAIASVGGTKPSAIMKSVLLLCLKFGITLGLLSSSYYIYGLFISPVMQGGLEMGLAVAQSSGGGSCSIEPVGSVTSQEISPELFNTVMGTVRCFSQDAATMPAIGMGLLCISETFSMFISGLILVFFGFMIWLAFSFYLIDATVQLGMLCAFVPLLIACWPFELTKQYTTKGVRMLMNSFFTFSFAGVLIMMATNYVTAAVTGGGASATGDLINAIDHNDKPVIEAIAAMEGTTILTLISCCIFAMKMIGNVSGLASQFAAGSGMSFGAKLGGIATSAATGATKWAAGKTAKLGGAGLKAISDKSGLTAAAKKGMGAVQRGWGKTWAGAGAAVGLGRFQNRNAGSATQARGTEEEQGRAAAPGDTSSLQNQINEQINGQINGRELSADSKQHIADSLTRADQLLQDLDAGGAKEEAAREELEKLGIDYREIQAGVGSGARDENVREARDKIATKMRINDRANNSGGSGDGGSDGGNGDNNTTTNNNNSGDENNNNEENENEQEQELEAKEEKEQEEKEEQEKAEEMKGYYTEMTGELGEDGSNSGGEDTVTTIDRSSDGDNGGASEGGSGGGESSSF